MERLGPRGANIDLSGRVPAHQLGTIGIGGASYRLLRLGAWSSVPNYVPGNVVTDSGTDYVCVASNTNDVPPSANWQTFDESAMFLRADRVWTPSTGAFIFPPTQEANLFNGGFNRDGALRYVKIDTGIGLPGGCYLNNFGENTFGGTTTVTPVNGDLFYARFALGPKGSTWKFQIGYITGPDYGKIQWGLASNAEDVDPGDGYGSVGRLVGSTGLTYVEPTPFWSIDGYTATNLATYDTLAVLQIGGSPGTPQTTLTQETLVFGSETGYVTDGGPGIYTLRGRVNGHHASAVSPFYKFGLWSVVAMRIAGDDSQD